MELFIPNILTVQPVPGPAPDRPGTLGPADISAPAGGEFRKVYFEELARRCYSENGNLDMLGAVARIHHEEYYGAGGGKVKRWRVFFSKYNVLVNIEEDAGGRLFVKAA